MILLCLENPSGRGESWWKPWCKEQAILKHTLTLSLRKRKQLSAQPLFLRRLWIIVGAAADVLFSSFSLPAVRSLCGRRICWSIWQIWRRIWNRGSCEGNFLGMMKIDPRSSIWWPPACPCFLTLLACYITCIRLHLYHHHTSSHRLSSILFFALVFEEWHIRSIKGFWRRRGRGRSAKDRRRASHTHSLTPSSSSSSWSLPFTDFFTALLSFSISVSAHTSLPNMCSYTYVCTTFASS